MKRDFGVLVLIASVVLMLVGWGAAYAMVVSLKPIAEAFGWPRAVPSLAISFQFLGSGLGGMLMGHLLDRAGMGKPALVGTLMIGGGMLAVSAFSAAWQLHLIYGVMIGLFGLGSLSTPLMANAIRWFDHRPGMAVGVVASGEALAGIVWPPVFGYMLGTIGWRDMFFWYGVLAIVVMLPMCLVVGRPPPAREAAASTAGSRARRMLVPGRRLAPRAMQITLCGAIIGCCVAMALPLSHIVSHVTDQGYSIRNAVEVMSVMLLTTFVSRVIGVGLLADNIGGLRALIAFSGVQAAALALLTFVDGLATFYIVGALFGFGYGGVFPVYAVIVREHMPATQAGRRTGLAFFFGALGMAFGSWLGGALFDLTGSYQSAFLVGVAFNLANIVAVVALALKTGAPTPRPVTG